ncbi:YkgJ family cysteine cluster protein [Candidatus Woesearchaeota archaeon]|nr:YkgJ family cysteine cluster protein [Candidatus Woesearchaeota archaeon]
MSHSEKIKKPSCKMCGGCCNHICIEIDPPKEKIDAEELLWWVIHEGVSIAIDEEGDWYLEIQTRCKAQGVNNLCTVYEKRPQICSDYGPDECTTNSEGDEWVVHMKTFDEVVAFLRSKPEFAKLVEDR